MKLTKLLEVLDLVTDRVREIRTAVQMETTIFDPEVQMIPPLLTYEFATKDILGKEVVKN
jgi:hypothetical protein